MPFLISMLGKPGGASFDTRYAPERVTVVEHQETGRLDVLDAPGDRCDPRELPVAIYERRDDLGHGHVCGSYADGARRGWATLSYTLWATITPDGEIHRVDRDRAEQLRAEFEREQLAEFLDQSAARREKRTKATKATRRAQRHGAQGSLF